MVSTSADLKSKSTPGETPVMPASSPANSSSSAEARCVRLNVKAGDVASLAWKWHKPLSARLLPVKGKKAGDTTEFNDPFLFNTSLHALP